MKGIVVAAEKDTCIILKKDGTFSRIQNKCYCVGQEIHIPSKLSFQKSWGITAACFILTCTSIFSGYALCRVPFSHVYLDINPSIRLDLNCFEKVLSIVPLNEDAENLLSAQNISSDRLESCITEIVDACRSQTYINDHNHDIEISAATHHASVQNAIQSSSAALEKQDLQVRVYVMDEAENQIALKQNLSAKALRAVKEYTAFFGGNLEENMNLLHEKSADDILMEIREHRRQTPGRDVSAEKTQPLTGKYCSEAEKETVENLRNRELSEKRETAIQNYTDYFGGNTESNVAHLQNLSISEIYAEIRNARQSAKAQRELEHTPPDTD